jgi:putative aldouronate transport system substrate-binding protein
VPANLVQSVKDPPGVGGDVTWFGQIGSSLPPPVSDNPMWQAINKALNVNLNLNAVSSVDYFTKAPVVMAGSDLPDLFFLSHSLTVGNIPQFLMQNFVDLTEYVAGDAIKDYPNLAAIPTTAWVQSTFNGSIFGVPIARGAFQIMPIINQTRFDALGIQHPKNLDDFKQILLQMTNPGNSQWGIGGIAPAFGLTYNGEGEVPLLGVFRTPNNWGVDSSGKFTKDIETDQFRMALSFVRDLYAQGVYYPDTLTQSTSWPVFLDGRAGLLWTGWTQDGGLLWEPGKKQNPRVVPRALHPFAADGGTPIWQRSNGFNGITAIKKASPDRVKELLRVLNYIAAPFGTVEYTLLHYGVKDVDYRLDDQGRPTATDKGKADQNLYQALRYVAVPNEVLFDPSDPEFVKAAFADEQAIVPFLVEDPALGLFSPTFQVKGSVLNSNFFDGVGGIVRGQAPLDSLNQLLATWRSGGGDQIRAEYQDALAASKK